MQTVGTALTVCFLSQYKVNWILRREWALPIPRARNARPYGFYITVNCYETVGTARARCPFSGEHSSPLRVAFLRWCAQISAGRCGHRPLRIAHRYWVGIFAERVIGRSLRFVHILRFSRIFHFNPRKIPVPASLNPLCRKIRFRACLCRLFPCRP